MFCSVNDTTEMRARHAEALKVLAERALALACAVQERALVAETDAGMAELGLAFHRIARSVRQCVALEAKLARDADQGAREARAEAARDQGAEVKRRKLVLRTVLTRDISDADAACEDDDDYDPAEACTRTERLESLLDEDELGDDFLALPVEDQIARLRDDLGLAEAALADGVSAVPHLEGYAGSRGGAASDFPGVVASAPNSS
jgi:hypothetical protein